jgi:hypothetical protein
VKEGWTKLMRNSNEEIKKSVPNDDEQRGVAQSQLPRRGIMPIKSKM